LEENELDITRTVLHSEHDNLRAIKEFAAHGIPVTAFAPGAKWTVESWGGHNLNHDAFTTDEGRIQAWHESGCCRFGYIPAVSGLIVLDFDKKNGKDGWVNFVNQFENSGNILPLCIKNPAVWVETPSDGRQLLYQYGREFVLPSKTYLAGFEVLLSGHLATTPGSLKASDNDGVVRPYILKGSLSNIQRLPYVVYRFLRDLSQRKEVAIPLRETIWSQRSLVDIAGDLDRQGHLFEPGIRNQYVFRFAGYAAKQGHRIEQVIQWLSSHVARDFKMDEIKRTVQSAYRSIK